MILKDLQQIVVESQVSKAKARAKIRGPLRFWLRLIPLRTLQNQPEPKPRKPSLSSWERGCAIPIREARIGWRGDHFWHFVRHVSSNLRV